MLKECCIGVALIALSACQTPLPSDINEPIQADANCRKIQHEMGVIEICGNPQRVIAIGPMALEILVALNIQPVGFADIIPVHQGRYDQPTHQIPYLGDQLTPPIENVGSTSNPSIETMARLQPDLILAERLDSAKYSSFSRIAPTLVVEVERTEENLASVAQAVNLTEEAEQILAETQQKITSAREQFEPFVAENPKLLLLSGFSLQDMYLGSTADHGTCKVVPESLGFQLVTPPEFDDSNTEVRAPISIETLPQLNEADLVVMLGADFNPPKQGDIQQFEENQLSGIQQEWEENAIAQSLEASKAEQVYFVPAYLCLGLPGPIGTALYLEELKAQLLSE